jgi:outer membrane protein assembly factor BamB
MSRLSLLLPLAALLAVPLAAVPAAPVPKGPPPPASWPMLGGTPSRNMVSLREKLDQFPKAAPNWGESEEADKKWEAEWVLWKARLGSRAHGSPVAAGGRVYVGTNNQNPRNKRDTMKNADGEIEPIDKCVLMCFEEKTGRFLWQAVHDKLPSGIVNDWPNVGLASSPAVVGDRLYYVSNQCRVVCASVVARYGGDPDAPDADVVWEYDMMKELKVFPHNMSNCSPLVVGDQLFVCTSNGVDESHQNLPSPDAPALICLDRKTGKLLWKDNSPGKNVMHGQWCNPSYAEAPVPQVIHGQGDGWLRAFDPATGKLMWQFDGNLKGAKYELGGTGDKSDFIGMPVVHGGRVFVGTGQDPEHSTGIANLWCVDLKKAVELGAKAKDRDVSSDLLVEFEKQADGTEKAITKPNPASALAWVFGGEEPRKWAPRDFRFGRTLSTVAVVDDVVYAAEIYGILHCLSAKTGEEYWQYDVRASVWGSPFFADGKVFLASEDGTVFVFRHDPKPESIDHMGGAAPNQAEARKLRKAARALVEKAYLLAKIELPAAIRATPLVVNGVLYVAAENALYAIGKK